MRLNRPTPRPAEPAPQPRARRRLLRRIVLATLGLMLLAGIGVAAAAVWLLRDLPPLPSVDGLALQRPAQPLRIYSSDGELLAEYGEERRELTPLAAMPAHLRQAVLAIEDARFYEHGGVDWQGLARAAWANLLHGRHGQGASTITMQLARNLYLGREKTYRRKLQEIRLAWRLEQTYGKDRLLERYMNQIYLGERAYGFAAAANIYFGKPVAQLSLAESAMLAGLPKAPSAYNPVSDPLRARQRQQYILRRMLELGWIDGRDYRSAVDERLALAPRGAGVTREAAYAAEQVRQEVVARYGERAAYGSGLDVFTTLRMPEQRAADAALRAALLAREQGKGSLGEGHVDWPAGGATAAQAAAALAAWPDSGELRAAWIAPGGEALLRDGRRIAVGVQAAALEAGSVIHVRQGVDGRWTPLRLPGAEGALVSLDAASGEVIALVGGFDFGRNQYDHASQAYRQPGSSFKPFVYSAALEKGYFPGTLVDDTRRLLSPAETGARAWTPRNYGDRYDGFIPVRRGLARSKNLVAVSLLQASGADYVRDFAGRFGFEPARNPASLPLALGAGAATPLQMAEAYAVFANGGCRVASRLIREVRDRSGHVFYRARPKTAGTRVVSARNAYLMDSMLREAVRDGTGRAAKVLGREDLVGKTGTSNRSRDAWFAGYAGGVVSVVWLGYDQPRSLGARATGASLALPVWTAYMKVALRGRPVEPAVPPDGLVPFDGDYVYAEYLDGRCLDGLPPYIRSEFDCARPVQQAGVAADTAPAGGTPVPARAAASADPVADEAAAEREAILKLFSERED